MMETILNLIDLSKAKDDLVAQLITGMIDEYISMNGEIKFNYNFQGKECSKYYDIQYVLYSMKNKIDGNPMRLVKYSYIRDFYKTKIYNHLMKEDQLELFNFDPLMWYKTYIDPKYNGRIVANNLGLTPLFKPWDYYYSQSKCQLRGFKLEVEDYFDRTIGDEGKYIKQAIIYIKYKKSKWNHPFIQAALDNVNRLPKSDCYLYLIKFNVETNEEGERLLKYLHHFIKDLI